MGPKLTMTSADGQDAWLEERYWPWFDSQIRQRRQASIG